MRNDAVRALGIGALLFALASCADAEVPLLRCYSNTAVAGVSLCREYFRAPNTPECSPSSQMISYCPMTGRSGACLTNTATERTRVIYYGSSPQAVQMMCGGGAVYEP